MFPTESVCKIPRTRMESFTLHRTSQPFPHSHPVTNDSKKNRQLVLKIWAHIPQVMNEPGDKTTFMKATFGTVFICDFALSHGPHPCMHPSFESSSGKFIRWNNKLFVICIFLRELTVQYIVSSRKNWKATCIRRSVWVFPTLHYITLHYATLHCSALSCIELHYVTLHCDALPSKTLHRIAVQVKLQCIAFIIHDMTKIH